MKIRNGFVSNSSSSSFTIYGAELSYSDLRRMLKDDHWQDALEGAFENSDIESHNRDYSVFVGRSWSSIKDDETGKQFKDRVKAELEKAFGEPVKCGIHSEAWYDG